MTNRPRTYIPWFFSPEQATALFEYFSGALDRKQYDITMFGKTRLQPRLVCFYGDEWVQYSYSKTFLEWTGRDTQLLVIKELLEKQTGQKFNSVLCNLYRDWNDSMGRHSDNEKELWSDPVIASCSFWQERFFHLKHTDSWEKEKILLEHWSCMIMWKWCQTQRQHAITKTKKLMQPRINLTFRTIYE